MRVSALKAVPESIWRSESRATYSDAAANWAS
jgi:hypothetical protein